MSDSIVVNVLSPEVTNINVNDTGENIYINPLTLNQGIINHSVTHQSGGSDELLHNLLGGLQGGSGGNYYHLTSGEYANLVTGAVVRPSDTGAFYPNSNPSGFITGVDLSAYVTGDVVRPSETGNFITVSQTGAFYPRSNPSGFIDPSQTGAFYAASNPSGFITGVDLSAYVTGEVVRPSQTGAFYPASNPSGFITGVDLSAYVTGSVVRPSETGNFISFTALTGDRGDITITGNSPTNLNFSIDSSAVTNTKIADGAITTAKIANFNVTTDKLGSLAVTTNIIASNAVTNTKLADMASQRIKGRISAGTSDPEDLTASQVRTLIDFDNTVSGLLSGYVTGSVVRPSETGSFITSSQTGAFYASSNPSGYITGVDLSNYATILYTTGISGDLQQQITALNNQTGSYVLDSETGNFITTSQTGAFYAASNPSGFITGIPDIVYTTGNQDISGLKDFQTRPTVVDVPVLLSGDAVDTIHLYGKNDEAFTLYKGYPVFINGANGANPLISLASNTGERTSSKTLGLMATDVASNDFGYIITEGFLEGFDTSAATAGDPMWLGPTGNIIYGTGNKPYGNNHLVSLGIVLRAQSNNGKVYVKVQNGFEIDELHKVYAKTPQDNDTLLYNSGSGAWYARQIETGDVSGINNYYLASNPSGFATPVDPVRTTLTGNGVLSTFAISGAANLINPSALIVAIDGALQEPSVDYSVNNGTITFTDPLASGAKAVVISPSNALVAGQVVPSDGSVTSSKIATGVTLTTPSLVGPVNLTSQDATTADRVMTRDLVSYEAMINGNEFRQFCLIGSQQFGAGSNAGAYNVVGMQASTSNTLSGSASAYTYDGVLSNGGFSGHPLRTNLLVDMFFHGVMLRVDPNTNWVARINFGVGAATRVPPAADVNAASSRQWGVEFYYDGANYVGRMYWYDTSMVYGTPFTIPTLTSANWPNLVYSIRMRQTTSGLLEFYINTPMATLGGGRLSNTPTASMQATWTNNFYGGRHINFEVANGTAAASINTRIHATNMYGRVKYEL